MNDMLSKEEALLYQKALITSMRKEIKQLNQKIGELESELQHQKFMISDVFAKNLKARIAVLEGENKELRVKLRNK